SGGTPPPPRWSDTDSSPEPLTASVGREAQLERAERVVVPPEGVGERSMQPDEPRAREPVLGAEIPRHRGQDGRPVVDAKHQPPLPVEERLGDEDLKEPSSPCADEGMKAREDARDRD